MIIMKDQTDYFLNSQHLIQSIIKEQFVISKGNVTRVEVESLFITILILFVIYAF